MTVSELCHFPTDDIASHSRFFPVNVYVPHHQLRNFISTFYEDRIYYVHEYDIFVLDLHKRQRSLVATVPFEARCLAAAHGWVCVGGEWKGDCAFVRIGEDESQVGNLGLDLVVDMLGKEIVNSMTIHCVPAKGKGQKDEIVVLISNNDRTVTLYSLSQQEVLQVLPHPKPMNYAAMSPDCSIIAAVGDANEVYFYQRLDMGDGNESTVGAPEYAMYDWKPLATPKIPAGTGVCDDYGFAVAFSPTGHLCAVSAQGGMMTVFDMHSLLENRVQVDNSISCTFKSSRPSLWGCVRSMAFSPAPLDLLAWTEDHGRVGIADVRRGFVRRQCLSLDQSESEVVQWEDITPSEYSHSDVKERLKYQHFQRMRSRGHLPVGARSFGEAQRQQIRHEMFSYHHGLDLNENERSVVDALETTMTDVEHQVSGPYSVNYTSSPSIRSSSALHQGTRSYEIQLLNPGTQAGDVHQTPQRRQSVVLSESTQNRNLPTPENVRAMMTASPAPMSEDNFIPQMSTNDLTPSHNNDNLSQPLPYNIPPSDPWHVIEAALATDRARESATGSTAGYAVPRDAPTTLVQIESAILAERRLSGRLERQLSDERRLAAILRTQFELRQRSIEAERQNISVEEVAEDRISPSLERVLQRQLQIEEDNGRQRSNELGSEIRNNSQRMERLLNERESLLGQVRLPHQDTNFSSARSSALPTTPTQRTDTQELESILRQMEEERRARRQRILDLETQVRRAESRVQLASLPTGVEGSESGDRHPERLLDARFLYAARAGSSAGTLRTLRNAITDSGNSPSMQSVTGRIRGAAIRRAEMSMNADRTTTSTAIPRTSELHGRASDSDMRMARIMMQRVAMDANGNWVDGQGLRNFLGARRNVGVGGVQSRASTIEAMMTEAGVGTAGIGWSPDGRYLFTGTEAGIFEFKIHTRDRMCFPAVEMR